MCRIWPRDVTVIYGPDSVILTPFYSKHVPCDFSYLIGLDAHLLKIQTHCYKLSHRIPTKMSLLVKGKGKFILLLSTEHHAMKTYWESGGIAPCIL
jgi:hypothetical protein